jgi:hypothetical protein
MRYSPLAGLAVAAALFLPAPAGAQTPRVKITGVRVGFPGSLHRTGSGAQTRFKPGHWAPVYVDLDVRDAPLKAGSYVLQVETTDSDDMQNVYVEKRFLPPIEVGEQPTLLTYVRFGNSGSEMTVKVLDAANPDREYRKEHLTQSDISGSNRSENYTYAYLSIGGKVRGLYKALIKAQNANQGGGEAEDAEPQENGTRTFANIETAGQMPTYWFGYQPADTVIMLTSEDKLIGELLMAQKDDPVAARRDALAEWVRRGGHLILSVSKNHQEVKQILEQMNVIDLAVEGRTEAHEVDGMQRLHGLERWAGSAFRFYGVAPKNQPAAKAKIEIAKLKPGPGVQVLAYDKDVANFAAPPPDAHPVLVQAPCGLGRVIVCAFDLDEAPFTAWKGQTAFWERMRGFNEPASVGDAQAQNQGFRPGFGLTGEKDELAGKLVHSLEDFPDVPVISFGWVALFILIYILIVGPLDYFFLKKVVKRLELTWITFPAVVIVISAIAYFAAYHLKGKDLRINKVDVVDVDLHGNAVYGSTWFTLFSPRIQNYTIGVEPGTGWGAEEKDPKKFAPFVSWMGRPEDQMYGSRGGSQGLFRRAYNYAPESSGLVGVPIQVWSTKTFSASWARPIKEDELVEARLEVAKNDLQGMKLSGTITSKLPVELRDAVLFYRNKFYKLDTLTPGTPLRIDDRMAQVNEPQAWFGQSLQSNLGKSGSRRGAYYGQEVVQPVGSYIKSILFHAYTGENAQQNAKNSSLRYLDERWRLDKDNTKEAILFGAAAPPAGSASEGKAEDMSQSGLSASKLWLGALPGEGKARSAIQGTLSQETYVRVYIPVK